MLRHVTLALGAMLASSPLSIAQASTSQDWPNWRGPNYDGTSPVTGLPVKLSGKKNRRWTCAMPGPGACTPIVLGKRVFLSSTDSERKKLVVLCVDRVEGKILWQRDICDGVSGGRRSNYASPSPASDGERVVFFFGNGEMAGFDLDGEKLWQRNLQKDYGDFAFQWTFSASPTIYEGTLYMPILQRNVPVARRRRPGGADVGQERKAIESFLLGMDPASGEVKWKHVRPSPARLESLESYTTLIPRTTKSGRKEIVCVGGDVLTGHDPKNGEELWRWGTWNPGHRQQWWRLVPTVVFGGDVALVCAPKRAPVFAIRVDGEDAPSGDLGEDALVCKSEGRPNVVSSDVPSPAYHDGAFFVLNDNRASISRVRAKDGEIAWTTQLTPDYRWRASPTVADGKVYCLDHNGNVVVLDAKSGEILHVAPLGEEDDDQVRASVVVAHGALFVRTNDTLFCFEKKD